MLQSKDNFYPDMFGNADTREKATHCINYLYITEQSAVTYFFIIQHLYLLKTLLKPENK